MKKDLLIIGFIVLLIAVLINGTNVQSVDEYYLTHADDIQEDSETVFLTIRCDTVLDNIENLDKGVAELNNIGDGIILDRVEYVLRKGDTVFDILD